MILGLVLCHTVMIFFSFAWWNFRVDTSLGVYVSYVIYFVLLAAVTKSKSTQSKIFLRIIVSRCDPQLPTLTQVPMGLVTVCWIMARSDLIKFNTHKTVSNILAVSVSKTDDLKKCISPSNFFLKNENLLGEK